MPDEAGPLTGGEMTIYTRWLALLRYMDLTTAGEPSFSKFVCVAILVASIVRGNLTLGVVVALLSASFGRSMWKAFLHRASVGATESVNVTAQHHIIERRDRGTGIEPAP